jgi:hypothetical protein
VIEVLAFYIPRNKFYSLKKVIHLAEAMMTEEYPFTAEGLGLKSYVANQPKEFCNILTLSEKRIFRSWRATDFEVFQKNPTKIVFLKDITPLVIPILKLCTSVELAK